MKKLVFICHGNTFRSPIAEAIFNHSPKKGWEACSYGTAVAEQNIDGLKISESPWPVDLLIEDMKRRGMDISEKRSTQLLPKYLDSVDKVIVMTEIEYVPDWLSEKNYERWEVPNTKVITQKILDDVVLILNSKIEELKKRL